MADAAIDDKVACFQAINGIEDPDLCVQILSIHNWDFDLAVSSFISTAYRVRSTPPPPNAAVTSTSTDPSDPGLAWKARLAPVLCHGRRRQPWSVGRRRCALSLARPARGFATA